MSPAPTTAQPHSSTAAQQHTLSQNTAQQHTTYTTTHTQHSKAAQQHATQQHNSMQQATRNTPGCVVMGGHRDGCGADALRALSGIRDARHGNRQRMGTASWRDAAQQLEQKLGTGTLYEGYIHASCNRHAPPTHPLSDFVCCRHRARFHCDPAARSALPFLRKEVPCLHS